MSDAEGHDVEEVKHSKSHTPGEGSEGEEDRASTSEEVEHEKVDVPYDPSAKPAKSILKKPGEEHSHKSEGHIHITSSDDAEHDAEKKKAPKKPMPVEGRTGVVMGGKKKGSISAGSGSAEPSEAEKSPHKETAKEEAPAETSKHEKKKKDKSTAEGHDEKDPEKCAIM